MLANSLIVGLITYTASVVYNLLTQKSMESVFYLSLRFLLYTTLMTLCLQLGFYLVVNYNSKDELESNNKSTENMESKKEAEEKIDSSKPENKKLEGSEVDNEFDNEEFSALNPEGFDYQQNDNQ